MGNTTLSAGTCSLTEDHPHIHGEYFFSHDVPPNRWGSPPHTWGIRVLTRLVSVWTRITPTYMGNTNRRRVKYQQAKDHPHIHGEYKCWAGCLDVPEGSPPHTWGILNSMYGMSVTDRITPTYMGNTACRTWLNMTMKDHPHIHGEYLYHTCRNWRPEGSPPHTWGILVACLERRLVLGITPTYMGNTA